MKKQRLIDANIILRFLTNDDPEKATACESLLSRVESGQEQVYLPDLIIADIIWTLEKYYRVEKRKIREMMIRILAPESLYCSSKSQVLSALAIYTSKKIDWTDAFVAAQMIASDLKEIYSYDQDFDRLQDITRITP